MSSEVPTPGGVAEKAAQVRFRELAALLPDYVVLVDRQRRYKWFNRLAPGLTEADVMGKRVDGFMAPKDLPKAIESIERCFETGESTEYRATAYGDGNEEWHFESRVVPACDDDGERAVMILTRNCTEQVAAENRFRHLLEASPDFILVIDKMGTVLYANRVDPQMEQRSVVGRSVLEWVPEEAMPAATRAVRAVLEDGMAGAWESTSMLPGSERFSVRILPIDGPDDARALLIAQDTSAQLQAARALQASEERLSRVMGASKIGLYEVDVGAQTGEISPAFAERLGLPCEIPVARWKERLHPADLDGALECFFDLEEGRKQSVEFEYRMRMKNGEYRRFLDRMLCSGSGKISGLVEDVTEVRQLEEHRMELQRQLEQAQRLESIGLLAGGVAHDFNNLLTVILNGTHLAQRALASGKDPTEELVHVTGAANRAAELTSQLLAFSRRSSLKMVPLDITDVVDQVVAMTRRVIPKSIRVSFQSSSLRAMVRGDRQQLEQTLLNLCINARDAMEEGGSLSISVGQEGSHAIVAVEDTGHGIDDGDVERIFEPFFTTKPIGAGTGLGLAMVHGIIQQHNGTISVSSRKGEGTRFEIRLPITDAEEETSTNSTPAPASVHGRILVAEDEDMVLEVVRRLLEEAGHEVVSARDGLEAVEQFQAHGGKFDLLLFDVVMPRLDGWRAYERIRAAAPDVRILFSSGYAAATLPNGLSAGPKIVAKPYEPETLLAAVAEALRAK